MRYLVLAALLAACGGSVRIEERRDAGGDPGPTRDDASDSAAMNGSCEAGPHFCDGNKVIGCDAKGQSFYIAECPFLCVEGACTGICSPGSMQCVAGHVRTCGDDAVWHESNDRCDLDASASDERIIDAGLDARTTTECAPGATRCADSLRLQSCTAAGTWRDVARCAFVCIDGECSGICTPGATQCVNSHPQVCDERGTWRETDAGCPSIGPDGSIDSSYMDAGVDADAARDSCPFGLSICDDRCVPGARQCDGNVPEVCSATGTFVAEPSCPFVCIAGFCSGCLVGVRRCNGNVVQQCDVTGEWTTGATCTFACISGVCAGACVPGDTRCIDGGSQICDTIGEWVQEGDGECE